MQAGLRWNGAPNAPRQPLVPRQVAVVAGMGKSSGIVLTSPSLGGLDKPYQRQVHLERCRPHRPQLKARHIQLRPQLRARQIQLRRQRKARQLQCLLHLLLHLLRGPALRFGANAEDSRGQGPVAVSRASTAMNKASGIPSAYQERSLCSQK